MVGSRDQSNDTAAFQGVGELPTDDQVGEIVALDVDPSCIADIRLNCFDTVIGIKNKLAVDIVHDSLVDAANCGVTISR